MWLKWYILFVPFTTILKNSTIKDKLKKAMTKRGGTFPTFDKRNLFQSHRTRLDFHPVLMLPVL